MLLVLEVNLFNGQLATRQLLSGTKQPMVPVSNVIVMGAKAEPTYIVA